MRQPRDYRIVECRDDGKTLVIVDTSLNEPIVSVKAGRAWHRANGDPKLAYRVIGFLTPELRVRLEERRVIEEKEEE